jgi:HlyD family secretion protein
MKRPPKAVVAVVVLAVAGALLWWVWRPHRDAEPVLSGYVEGDTLQLSAPVAGLVSQVSVAQGQRVAAGAPLFVMDARSVDAQQAEARAAVAQGQTQVDAAEAAVRQAEANARAQEALAVNARTVAERYTRLRQADPGALAAQELDRAVAEARAATAQAEAARRLAAAARAQVAAARAGVTRAGAGLSELGVRADLLAARAPATGRIEEVYFQTGEWAGANQPVISLLPDARVKLRFYVPEAQVAAYRPGATVRFRCDGCGAERSATIIYVSPRSEFTPPVIYSRESRDRLVFLVEARPTDPATLTPGLPVDVVPLRAERAS